MHTVNTDELLAVQSQNQVFTFLWNRCIFAEMKVWETTTEFKEAMIRIRLCCLLKKSGLGLEVK